MSGSEVDESEDFDDLEAGNDDEIIDDSDDDSDIDLTAEINVDDLVARVEKQNKNDIERKKQVRRRLEELQEQRLAMRDLDSTYNFNLDDDF